ncbi:MAG: heat-inducible transcriptional repressor HrcA [Micrococcales bacterium]
MIPERSLEVLRAIVHDYIETSQPVGSKTLVERHSFGVSSATIRNEMALLEDEQLIVAPHTSSGRVPTDKGYRLFVDRLGEVKPLSISERTAIETFMQGSADLDEILGRTVRLLAQLTNQVAMVQYPSLEKGHVKSVELIRVAENQLILLLVTDISRVQQHLIQFSAAIDDEFLATLRAKLIGTLTGSSLSQVAGKLKDFAAQFAPNREAHVQLVLDTLLEQVDANRQDKIILAGTANLARNEDDFKGSISPMLEAIEEQVVLLRLIQEMQAEENGVALRIGSENLLSEFSSSSVVVSGYEKEGSEVAKLGVLGPTRMNYSANISAVRAVARYLTQTLGGL